MIVSPTAREIGAEALLLMTGTLLTLTVAFALLTVGTTESSETALPTFTVYVDVPDAKSGFRAP
ncbi:hypothetical protein D3C72_1330990 [compost metagenome]